MDWLHRFVGSTAFRESERLSAEKLRSRGCETGAVYRCCPDGWVNQYDSVTGDAHNIPPLRMPANPEGRDRIVVAHYHPSGNPGPSLDDFRTDQRAEAGTERRPVHLIGSLSGSGVCYVAYQNTAQPLALSAVHELEFEPPAWSAYQRSLWRLLTEAAQTEGGLAEKLIGQGEADVVEALGTDGLAGIHAQALREALGLRTAAFRSREPIHWLYGGSHSFE